MAKSKTRKKRKRTVTPEKAPRAIYTRRRIVAGVVAVALVAGGGWWWYVERQAERAFLAHARRGEAALGLVVRHPDEGRGHLAPGERVRYVTDPPTSGVHDPDWIDPGVYDSVQQREKLVHSLEHGMIVVYYDTLPADVLATLEDWADLYGAPWSGIVLTPRPGLGAAVILTAWRRTLRLDAFDADAAAAFIDAFRGRGPENPVR